MAEKKNMIPRIIHYCWFGGNPLPEMAQKCIESWKKYCPDYQIKEWNERNFDINCCVYVKEAYEAKKWAFVSDYARFWILYHEGGLYFDTDVELIRPINDILEKGAFMGCEQRLGGIQEGIKVAPGLGLAAIPNHKIYKELIDLYKSKHFYKEEGGMDTTTIVFHTTEKLRVHGLKDVDMIQCIDDIYIYPSDYFCPLNYRTGELVITKNTRAIHHYSESWHSCAERITNKICRVFARCNKSGHILEKMLTLPFRFWNKISLLGFKGTFIFILKKYVNKK